MASASPARAATSRPTRRWGRASADIDASAGEAAAAALRAQGANAIFVATDVTKREAIEALSVERAVASNSGGST